MGRTVPLPHMNWLRRHKRRTPSYRRYPLRRRRLRAVLVLLPNGSMSMSPNSRFAKGNQLLQLLSAGPRPARAASGRGDDEAARPLRKSEQADRKHPIPKHGYLSVVAKQNGSEAEIGLIGCEGMSGVSIILGDRRSANATYVQVAGDGRQISSQHLRAAMDTSRSMHAVFLQYVQAFMAQTAHTAIANGRAKLPERLARWLLMAHDRIPGDRLSLTHEFLALMLAVRRAGVTEAVHHLESRELIKASRGEIVVRNGKGLERSPAHFMACRRPSIGG